MATGFLFVKAIFQLIDDSSLCNCIVCHTLQLINKNKTLMFMLLSWPLEVNLNHMSNGEIVETVVTTFLNTTLISLVSQSIRDTYRKKEKPHGIPQATRPTARQGKGLTPHLTGCVVQTGRGAHSNSEAEGSFLSAEMLLPSAATELHRESFLPLVISSPRKGKQAPFVQSICSNHLSVR